MKPEVEILRKARELLAKPESWTQHADARDRKGRSIECATKTAAQWSVAGALSKIAGSLYDANDALRVIKRACGLPLHTPLDEWNDAPERTHAEVLALLDRAIEEVER